MDQFPTHTDSATPPALSVVSPVYGCSGCLESLVERILGTLEPSNHVEVILVDDASPDGAWKRIEELAAVHPQVRGVRLSRNFGQQAAIAAGLAVARGKQVIVMDCDLQDVPEEIPKLLANAADGVDIVLGQRQERQDSVLKRFGSYVFYRVLSWLTGAQQDHTVANFGVYSRKVIDIVNSMPEADRVFSLMVGWTGLPAIRVPVLHDQRQHGKSGYSLTKLARLALHIILSYSDKPLRMVVKLGLVFATLSLCIVVVSVWRYLIGDVQVAGFTSIIASIWLLGSIMILCMGLIGLYVGRLYNDAKGRPAFIVSETTSMPGANDA
jgi:polyisoprenyl-phosphate glycosyltransferase